VTDGSCENHWHLNLCWDGQSQHSTAKNDVIAVGFSPIIYYNSDEILLQQRLSHMFNLHTSYEIAGIKSTSSTSFQKRLPLGLLLAVWAARSHGEQ